MSEREKKLRNLRTLCQLLVERQNEILQLISDALDELDFPDSDVTGKGDLNDGQKKE